MQVQSSLNLLSSEIGSSIKITRKWRKSNDNYEAVKGNVVKGGGSREMIAIAIKSISGHAKISLPQQIPRVLSI